MNNIQYRNSSREISSEYSSHIPHIYITNNLLLVAPLLATLRSSPPFAPRHPSLILDVTRSQEFNEICGIDASKETLVGCVWYGYPEAEVKDVKRRKPLSTVLSELE